jgi:hypothetical protein
MGNQTHPAYRGPWPRIRKQILTRDNHTCQIQSPRCTTHATVVDHIIPITAGGAWWDPDNLRASCQSCNNNRIDRTRKDTWRTAPTHINLIIGPPGAGKTTHTQTHAKPDDLIIDYDQIKDALGKTGQGTKTGVAHTQAGPLHQATMTARNAILRSLREGKTGAGTAWIISANPKAESIFPYHKLIIIDPGIDEVLRRAQAAGRPPHWQQLIREWYETRSGSVPSKQKNSRQW